MAKISKSAKKAASGLPTKEQLLLSPGNTDTVPGMAHDAQGLPSQPIAVTEGEFVISIPAIIGLGEGDYEKGLQTLTQIHDELKAHGEALMGGQSQGDAPVLG